MSRISQGDPFKEFVISAGRALGTLSKELLKETFSYLFASVHLGGSFAKGSLGELLTPRNDDKKKSLPTRALEKTLDSLEAGFKQSSHKWNKFLTEREKAAFTRGTIVLSVVTTGAIINSASAEEPNIPSVPQWPNPERRLANNANRSPDLADFSLFKNPQQALFVCAGSNIGRDFRAAYSDNPRFKFYQGRSEIITGTFSPSPDRSIRLVFVDANRVTQSELGELLSQKDISQRFPVIFYRGHSHEMRDLVEFGTGFESKFCFTQMGGCRSVDFIQDFHTPETPAAAVATTGFWARNNHWNIALLEGLSSPHVDSWVELSEEVSQKSYLAGKELVIPGTPGYRAALQSLDRNK